MALTAVKCFYHLWNRAGGRHGLEMCCRDVGRAKFRVAEKMNVEHSTSNIERRMTTDP